MLCHLALALSLFAAPLPAQDSNWHQGPGPKGDWSAEGPQPPIRFSVRTGENILWTTPLPETGQGGIAIWGEHVFVATMAPWDPANGLSAEEAELYRHATENRKVVGKDIDAHCLDARTGKVLWTRRLKGEVPAIYSYPFSDATSSSPVTDGERVWFTNAAGVVTCFDFEGSELWSRRFTPNFDGPFNKQFEPFLVQEEGRSVLVHMEAAPAPGAEDANDLHGRWHYLFGLDGSTGEVLWRSQDALTQYNAPTMIAGRDVLHARGGPHAVPELPLGISRTHVRGTQAGESLWRYEDPRANHEASLQTMAFDERYAYWLLKDKNNLLVVLDVETGKVLREISLLKDVRQTTFDPETEEWRTEESVDLELGVFPARYSMIAAGGFLYFQCYATAWGKPTIGPAYSFARVDPVQGKVEYLEVPTDVERSEDGEERFLWREKRSALALNSRGVEVTGDDRSHWDGWDWVFNGSPTRVNDRLYFTLASGVVYVLGAGTERFDETAFLALDDLGTAGRTWTANSLSYAKGRLYHRTAAALFCIGEKAGEER